MLQELKKKDRRIADTLDYSDVAFHVSNKDYGKIEDKKENICVNVFSNEGRVVCPIYISEKGFDDCLNLLMSHEEERPHYVYIKDFNRLMFNKTKKKCKK